MIKLNINRNRKHRLGSKKTKQKHENPYNPANRRFPPKINLREDQVFITEFVTHHEGFTGVVKSRYSDFHVNEIDLNGKTLQLTDLFIPKEQQEEKLTGEPLEAAKAELRTWVNDEKWVEIVLLCSKKGNPKEIPPVEIDVSHLDKESRTKMHSLIKKIFGKVIGSTVTDKDDESKKTVRIKKNGPGQVPDQRWTFPGEYVHFLVHKTNASTTDVASTFASFLKLRPSQVNYCGTKDKRAITTQKFAVKYRKPTQIEVVSTKVSGVTGVGNFEFSNETLKLGELKGNRFRIALRHIDADQKKIVDALEQLRENGFVNYFGLQRFGNSATVPTHEIGAALLKCDYKLACELILKPRESDIEWLQKIREFWWETRDSKAASAKFRGDKYLEKKLLNGLAQYGEKDYASALRKIPRNMLTLYPHAFQSLIFNKIVSRRIKEFGLKLIPGDLVYRNKDEMDVDVELEEIKEEENEAEDQNKLADGETENANEEANKPQDKKTENITEGTEKNGAQAEGATEESIFKRKVRALTEEDVASNNYSVFDVVLPLPGYDVTYPANVVGEWYEEALGEHELSSEKLRHKVKTFSMPGAYRKVFIQPTDLSWKFVKYNKPEDTLIASDLEILKKQQVEIDDKDGKFTGLLLDFCLPTAAYATMLLRELLRADTSNGYQTKLEQQERDKLKAEQAEGEAEKMEADIKVEETEGEVEEAEGKVEEAENIKKEDEEKNALNKVEKRKVKNQNEEGETAEAKKVKSE